MQYLRTYAYRIQAYVFRHTTYGPTTYWPTAYRPILHIGQGNIRMNLSFLSFALRFVIVFLICSVLHPEFCVYMQYINLENLIKRINSIGMCMLYTSNCAEIDPINKQATTILFVIAIMEGNRLRRQRTRIILRPSLNAFPIMWKWRTDSRAQFVSRPYNH